MKNHFALIHMILSRTSRLRIMKVGVKYVHFCRSGPCLRYGMSLQHRGFRWSNSAPSSLVRQ